MLKEVLDPGDPRKRKKRMGKSKEDDSWLGELNQKLS
jgi:hypothetical protein